MPCNPSWDSWARWANVIPRPSQVAIRWLLRIRSSLSGPRTRAGRRERRRADVYHSRRMCRPRIRPRSPGGRRRGHLRQPVSRCRIFAPHPAAWRRLPVIVEVSLFQSSAMPMVDVGRGGGMRIPRGGAYVRGLFPARHVAVLMVPVVESGMVLITARGMSVRASAAKRWRHDKRDVE
jgi:hypothetical protein